MSFSLDVSQWVQQTKEHVVDVRRQILLRLFRDVVMDTPVDEGTLRSNWQTNAVNPLTGPLSERALSEVFSEMESVLSGARLEDDIFLTNNLPYAYPIEFLGWSHTKAPQGMVRKNVIRLTQIAQAVARSNK
jgi:hypothetical protein